VDFSDVDRAQAFCTMKAGCNSLARHIGLICAPQLMSIVGRPGRA
jgi:hypothetical protein